jgi:hypothetical protein
MPYLIAYVIIFYGFGQVLAARRNVVLVALSIYLRAACLTAALNWVFHTKPVPTALIFCFSMIYFTFESYCNHELARLKRIAAYNQQAK